MIAVVLLFTWAVSAFVCTGLAYRHLDSSHIPHRETLGSAICLGMFFGLLGPLGVLLSFLISGFAQNGFGFTPATRKL